MSGLRLPIPLSLTQYPPVPLLLHRSVLLLYLLGMTSRPIIIHFDDHPALVRHLSMNITLHPGSKPHLVHAYKVMVVVSTCKQLLQHFFITCLRHPKGNHYATICFNYVDSFALHSDSTFTFKSRSPGYATWGEMASKLDDESFRAEYVFQSAPFLPQLCKMSK